ncbi:chorismate synthase [Candidatus Sumerlaeota bacterium]|nr:chorismate synthase [Candidatus Sumerlaeota bacterium]
MLRYVTAGESHGQVVLAILLGYPAGVELSTEEINLELAERQKGYGRGGRMKIEKDTVKFLSGVRLGRTLGSPIAMMIENRDWKNWQEIMNPQPGEIKKEKIVTRPRPGHADLAGALKFAHHDIRNVLERASARETVARVAVGAVCKTLLRHFGISVFSFVVNIGGVKTRVDYQNLAELRKRAKKSAVRCPDPETEQLMTRRIDEARERGDSLGGIFEVIATGVPIGLGSPMSADERLDGQIAQAILSIPGIKGVEFGLGFASAELYGSEVHDEIFYEPVSADNKSPEGKLDGHGYAGGFYHRTNRAGGLEGGMTNGAPIIVRAVMKPIPTLQKPLQSVDLETKQPFSAAKERSDVCAVPSAAVVGEAAVAFVLARAFLAKFGGDSLNELSRNYQAYIHYLEER